MHLLHIGRLGRDANTTETRDTLVISRNRKLILLHLVVEMSSTLKS